MGHLFITGSGRAGTTALVELLDACGLDTGVDHLAYYSQANAGYEQYPDGTPMPRVIKSPLLAVGLDGLLEQGFDASSIEAIVLPLRRIEDAAASRIDVFEHHGLDAKGGLWVGYYGRVPVYTRPSAQRRMLAEAVCTLLMTAAEHGIPVITLNFPRFVSSGDYAWERLSPLLTTIDRDEFIAAHARTMKHSLVHDRPERSRWQLRRLDLRWWAAVARRHLVARRRGERIAVDRTP